MTEFLTDQELCERLGISLDTLRRQLKKDLEPIERVEVGRKRRWLKESVDKFMYGAEYLEQEEERDGEKEMDPR